MARLQPRRPKNHTAPPNAVSAVTRGDADAPGVPHGKPGRFVDDYLAYLLARVSHQVSHEFHRELRPYRLSVIEWRVLATLEGSDGCSLGELAEAVLFKQPTVTKLIDRMERDGWVKRLPGADDRRRVRIVITARGRTVARELFIKAKQHEATCLSCYTADEIEHLKRILRDLLHRSAQGSGS